MGACNGYRYHELRPDKNVASDAQVEALLSYPGQSVNCMGRPNTCPARWLPRSSELAREISHK